MLLCTLGLSAQRPIGDWDNYMPYRVANSLSGAGNELYIAAGNSFYYQYSIDGGTIELPFNSERLSDTDPELSRYNPFNETLVLTYGNSVIDLVRGDKVTRLDGLANNNFYVDKTIHEIHFIENRAFLSCGFGLVIIDLDSGLFLDDFPIGAEGATIPVYDIVDFNDRLYAATQEGILSINKNNSFIDNFGNWTRYGESDPTLDKPFREVCVFNGKVYASSGSELYVLDDEWNLIYGEEPWEIQKMTAGQSRLIISEYKIEAGSIVDSRVALFESPNQYTHVNELFIGRPSDAFEDGNGVIWVADNWFGLLKIVNGAIEQRITPNGPYDHKAKNIAVVDGKIYVAPGDLDWALNPPANSANRAGFYVFDGTWTNYTQVANPVLTNADDIAFVKPHPSDGSVYFGSFKNGLVKFEDGQPSVLTDGSTLSVGTTDPARIRATGMDFDGADNLWICNHIAEKPLAVYTADGSWKSFGPFVPDHSRLFNVLVDRFGQKWCLISRYGIVVFDEGDDIFDDEDDRFRVIRNSPTQGNLQHERVFCIAEDHDGEIWVGTNDGIAVFYCASQVFSENGCDASRPTLVVDGENRYLMQEQIIRAIAIDGGNRKWIGTDNGLRLFSADGKEDLAFYTAENSPLLSNQILSLAYDEKSGALYIGTEKGINSFQTKALGGGAVHENVLVYPNPVRPEYEGPIAIKGLVENAEVKITDIAGNLIFETEALGSQATWDGKNYNGRRAATGVYLVFSSNADGTETFVTKLFFVN